MQRIILSLAFLLLSACATLPAPEAPLNQQLSWSQRQAQLQPLQQWQLQGLVGIRYQNTAQSANVNLKQNGNNYHLEIYGPLGADRVILDGQPGSVTLKTSDGQIIHAASPEALLQQRLGWSLPVTNLYYWLRGLPAPQLAAQPTFDRYNHLTSLQQQGWTINYLRYAGINGVDLPTKIQLKNKNLQATIIISQWQPNG